MEKVIILLIDATLNWYFVRVVKRRLVSQGLTKYDRLVKFNVRIIMVSLAMDVSGFKPENIFERNTMLIHNLIGCHYRSNEFEERSSVRYPISRYPCIQKIISNHRYIQLHPLAYIVKLNIEISMASLISKVARDGNMGREFELPSATGTRSGKDTANKNRNSTALIVHTQKEIIVDSRSIEDDEGRPGAGSDSDDKPLRHEQPWQGRTGGSATATAV